MEKFRELFNELKEMTLSKYSEKIGEISKRHGGDLTKQDINDLEYYIRIYRQIENL